MFESLIRRLSREPSAPPVPGAAFERRQLAVAALLVEAAHIDRHAGRQERDAVGRLLRELGARHQVLCVTHLPQVAACGDHHYEVSKATRQGATLSNIQLLSADGRIDEVARMLGGLKITNTTRQHAREMLSL